MCCQSMRILILFSATILSFVLNYFFSSIKVVIWYLILINIASFIVYFIDFRRLKNQKEGIKLVNLYYFSAIGGVFGAILSLAFSKFYEKTKLFKFVQIMLLVFWSIIIYLGYKNYTQIGNIFN